MKFPLIFSLALSLLSNGSLAAPNQVGDIPFDLVGKTLEGDEIKISDYKGKVVIVSFWASWCGPCKKELPVLAGIQKSATPEKLQVISVNIDEDRQLFKNLVNIISTTQMKIVHDGNKKTAKNTA